VRSLYLLLAAALVAGCAETGTSLVESLRQALRPGAGNEAAIAQAQLDPRRRYLRVTHEGGVALLLLNFVDQHPNGPVEIWYSADAQVFRFQNARLGGNTGLLPEWRSVSLPKFPDWSALARQSEPLRWERYRDVMPGYRFGVHDRLSLFPIPAPRSSALVGIDPTTLQWFEERTEPDSSEPLPPARYAVRGETVVYGEQCVSAKNCFTWQRWPAGS
jgi:hypothetical protein